MAREPFPSETQDRFLVRFPEGMRDRIREAAEENKRSMNAEIVARLEQTFSDAMVDIKEQENPHNARGFAMAILQATAYARLMGKKIKIEIAD